MNESDRDQRACVYEIGYLIAGVPEERVSAEADSVRNLVTGSGATVIAEEAPRHESLAYTIRRKGVSGAYDKFDQAYFGWIKFELDSDKVEALKKAVELVPSVLRMLLTTTVRESTYLGKHASVVAAAIQRKPLSMEVAPEASPAVLKEAVAPVIPATVEEMDKSIDDMVKEA